MKNCANIRCNKKFEPKNPKGKFCSEACRQMVFRDAKRIPGVTTANLLKEPAIKAKHGFEEIDLVGAWEYCQKNKLTLADLIGAQESNKPYTTHSGKRIKSNKSVADQSEVVPDPSNKIEYLKYLKSHR